MPLTTVVPTVLLDTVGEPEVVGPSPNTNVGVSTLDTLPGYDTTDTFPTHNPIPTLLPDTTGWLHTLDTVVPFNTVVPERLLDTIDHGDTVVPLNTVVPERLFDTIDLGDTVVPLTTEVPTVLLDTVGEPEIAGLKP